MAATTSYVFLEEQHRQQVGHDGRRDDTDESRHHERVVQQVFTNNRRS